MPKLPTLLLWMVCLPVLADGPPDNLTDNVRRQPPAGVAITENERASLASEAARLGAALEAVRGELKGKPGLLRYFPDVQVFHKAVDWALRYDEFFNPGQTAWAGEQLREGFSRLESLKKGELPWLSAHGLVVRGYESKIDGSVQPFGLVVPESFQRDLPWRWRLDCWFHGRGETLTELDFIHQRRTQPGEFTPPDTLVLHPYGRYCNGQRFAGETDFFEALETVKRDYRVDPDRIVVRGFSLGGAACWHIATHHAWQWAAANPGAGFSETEQFLNFFQGEKLQPAPWERMLWNLYDSTAVAGNLFNCPTVAYSGEIDRQKQAADLMALAIGAKDTGLLLKHVIGPGTAHKYEAGAKQEVAATIDTIAAAGRRSVPAEVRLETYTLKYNRSAWIQADTLEEHWKPALITATYGSHQFHVGVKNVSAFSLRFEPGTLPETVGSRFGVAVNEGPLGDGKPDMPAFEGEVHRPSDRSLNLSFARRPDGGWSLVDRTDKSALRKKHNLQGPIDDAFMDSFIFVRPTGQAANEKAGAWAKAELDRAIEHWRRHFRGDARVKDDTAITEEDIKSSNLILWGDPSSNAVTAKTASKLPITWTGSEIKAGGQTFPAADHVLICIYPNPLNPERYVVLNSSFTFRDYDYLNNARQTPKLPDWAVIGLDTPPNSRTPGKIAAADFFGEKWELK
ncbi:MAG: prolyl oligopeptidase family protein [Verrucomicrobiales bacterium]|nr:prolyl oligopeptidase family protein [Verrucomicrobiales bacterium]